MFRFFSISFLTITVLNPLSCQMDAELLAKKLGIRPSEFRVRIERSVEMKTSDGVVLRADIYHPRTNNPKPTILMRLPFSDTWKNRYFSSIVGKLWASRGYHVVMQGVRGKYKSNGIYYPLTHEYQDGLETLQWLAQQSWYDGHLGMWGGSYFGYTQWVLADQKNPGPAALAIQLSSTNFYEMLYPGGVFSLESALIWAVWSTESKDRDIPWKILKQGFEGLPLIKADNRAAEDVLFFNDWLSHPQEDEYWKKMNVRGKIQSLQAPVLMMAGWYDPFLPSQLEDFKKIKENSKSEIANQSSIIIGPWGHARTITFPNGFKTQNYRLESLASSLPWFDRYLLGRKDNLSHAPVKIFVMGKNIWREENEWPLERTKYTTYYFRSKGKANTANGDGILSLVKPEEEISNTYLYDPQNPVPTAGGTMIGPRAGITNQNDIETRQDVLIYSTPSLEKDLEVTGPIKVSLFVSTTAVSTDFTAKLVDVHPNGSVYNVCDGILRKNYPKTGKPVEIEIDLWPTSMVFLKNHKIRVEISSSNFPRFARNLNTIENQATEKELKTAQQTIYSGGVHASQIILPVIPEALAV